MKNRLNINNISAQNIICITSAVLGVVGLLIMAPTSHATTATTTTTTQSVSTQPESKECVILLHGLARTSASMNDLEDELLAQNFIVANIDYPSRKHMIEELSKSAVGAGLEQCAQNNASTVHVVTHSMGGILFRQYVEDNGSQAFGRTVMLAPPNKGSEVVDALRNVPSYEMLNGPAGLQLGTDSDSVPLNLGGASSDVAVIAGTFSVNLILSTYLPDPDDGKVSVESSKLDGMCAHLQVNVSHPFIMGDEEVMQEVISYLNTGKFISKQAEYPDCDFRESN